MATPDALVPVKSQTIATHVYQQLRQAIHRGQLKPGQRLQEGELAERLQVSRATVREAFGMLQSKGLVVNKHRRGTYVAELTTEDLRDIYNFRTLLEQHAVRLGARGATPEELAELQRLIDELHGAAAQPDFERIVDLDLRFHYLLCQFARSKRLLETWVGMETMLRAFLLLKYALYDDSALIAGSHQGIVDALRQHDGEQAARMLSSHITETAERVLANLEQQRQVEEHAPVASMQE
ncbi:MAG TPA: GntR family transcriptional regulator [Thermomicrobiales bacterium]|jgi:DNA-binding GntR family transcriptional regulator|nr:GntR family transcriptional regulator [Thermomicrobiales bacterium]